MSSRTIVGLWPTVVLSDPARWVGLNPLTAKRPPPPHTSEMDKEKTSKFCYWSGKTLGPLEDKKLSRAPCIVFKYTLIPISDRCVPSFLKRLISLALILLCFMTYPPTPKTIFLTARFTRFRIFSIALPSLAVCQYLLYNNSFHTILTSGNRTRRRNRSHSMSWTSSNPFVLPRSFDPTCISIIPGDDMEAIYPCCR